MNININVNGKQQDNNKMMPFGRQNADDAKSVRSTLAKKRADKLVGNVFKSDKKTDLSVNEMKDKREALLSDTTKQLKELSDLKDQRKEMLSQADDPVMAQNIKDIDERMTEIWKKVEENRALAKTYSQAVSDVKVERLKSHAMVDASNEAEDLLIQSAKELAASLMEEAKSNIEEKMEQTKEEAQKAKEKQEEKKPDKDKTEETLAEKLVEQSKKKEDADEKIKKMIDELNLLMDDIKGIEVDTNI
ncbi:MAG TPA: hypothetical protein DEO89_09470 [Lachnospiraceae bacterium]|nr:hypothetical protein [Lachnospiraceae bacterium]